MTYAHHLFDEFPSRFLASYQCDRIYMMHGLIEELYIRRHSTRSLENHTAKARFSDDWLTNEINKGLSSDLESNKFNGILRMELGSNPTQSYSLCVFCSLQNMGIFDFCFCSSFFVNVDAYGYMMVFLCEGSKGENRMENFQLGIRYYT